MTPQSRGWPGFTGRWPVAVACVLLALILVFIIGIGLFEHCEPAYALTGKMGHYEAAAESGFSNSIVNIAVVNIPKTKQSLSPNVGKGEFFIGQSSAVRELCKFNRDAAWYNAWVDRKKWCACESRLGWQIADRGCNGSCYLPLNICGVSIPVIDDNEIHKDLFPSFDWFVDPQVFNPDSRPMSRVKFVASEFDLLADESGLPPGNADERYCEKANDSSGNRCNCGIVRANPSKPALNHEPTRGEYVLFWLFVLTPIWAGVPAALMCYDIYRITKTLDKP
jgi:hypothetical protein